MHHHCTVHRILRKLIFIYKSVTSCSWLQDVPTMTRCRTLEPPWLPGGIESSSSSSCNCSKAIAHAISSFAKSSNKFLIALLMLYKIALNPFLEIEYHNIYKLGKNSRTTQHCFKYSLMRGLQSNHDFKYTTKQSLLSS